MARFRIINNTTGDLPLSDSSKILAQQVKEVEQTTLELKRLEQKGYLTIVTLPDLYRTDDTNLVPDYIGVRDPCEFGASDSALFVYAESLHGQAAAAAKPDTLDINNGWPEAFQDTHAASIA